MSTSIADIVHFLEALAPPAYQESYDNAGLLTGSGNWDCTGVLTTLDATEEVVMEAVSCRCNLIVAHHPIIFGGLKKITGRNYVERTVIAAIKRDIAIYAIHTNLDNVVAGGVNGRIAQRLGIVGGKPLLPREGTLQKLYCFVPSDHLESVRAAVFAAGAGHIGGYSECSYSVEGTGTFTAGVGTNPYVGEPGRRHYEKEGRLEVIVPTHLSREVVQAMIAAHPYEEVAYDLVPLANSHPGVGSGLIGELPAEMGETEFLDRVRREFEVPVIRHTRLTGRPVKKVAVCGGAGSFLISRALAAGANFYVTSDVKYHEFFDANDHLVVADIGHFESEQFTVDLLFEVLQEKFRNFAVLKSVVKTNPIKYYY
ncbi:MAG TPA: Nif3-like dinuclear metal center hexameric protein [Puia sp.]|uniref:Nif3-like dinuclear metal center hexameric protein n=1 Tax=Puia sp. TaxID=2045100 RepID=UPI002C582190|nr:Nif3-like dinuclear metal center hexameric protein [Puia sp.]HVU95050.1 Nif3-like dinuclear metal center hexameric protein [Puia sp.]